MSSTTQAKEFSKLRSLLWPIHGFEMKKFFPMFAMFFFVSFNYSTLRIMKDSLIVNAPGSGAEAIPFLKIWGTTPAAILFMIFYVKLSTILSRKNLFYAALAPFLTFFLVFPLVLYPAIDYIHPTTSADWLASVIPAGLNGIVALYRNWTFALFYILSELWGSVVLSTMYWGFANEVTKVNEAKRFYGLLAIGANIALLFVYPAASFANSLGSWGDTLQFVMLLAAGGTIAVAGLYWYINEKVMADPRFAITEAPQQKKKKQKMGFLQSVKELVKSPYLATLAFIVLAYGISINLVEISWKHNLKVLFAGDQKAFFDFQGRMMTLTGFLTILMLFFGTGNVLRYFGWKTAALLTPIVLFVTSAVFFANLTFGEFMQGMLSSLGGISPLLIVAWAGGLQNALSKSTKYAFFDPTKEMAYIPLDENSKRTGKAAIDGVGGRLGKSGGSFINMVLIGICGTIDAIAPYVGLVTMVIVGLWIVGVFYLNKQFVALTETSEKEEVAQEKKLA